MTSTRRPIMALLDLMNRKWTMRILWELHQRSASFRELQQLCDNVSPSVLNRRLSELKQAKLVEHQSPHGYRLTQLATELVKHFCLLNQWSIKWQNQLQQNSSEPQASSLDDSDSDQ